MNPRLEQMSQGSLFPEGIALDGGDVASIRFSPRKRMFFCFLFLKKEMLRILWNIWVWCF